MSEKVKITVGVNRKLYNRVGNQVEESGEIMLSESREVDVNDTIIEGLKLQYKMERQMVIGFYMKGFLTKNQLKEEFDKLEKRYDEVVKPLMVEIG